MSNDEWQGLEAELSKSLLTTLDLSRIITQKYIDKYGLWSMEKQLLHIHSEISEAYEAQRSGNVNNMIEELIDIILSATTAANLFLECNPHSGNLFKTELEKTVNKVISRLRDMERIKTIA